MTYHMGWCSGDNSGTASKDYEFEHFSRLTYPCIIKIQTYYEYHFDILYLQLYTDTDTDTENSLFRHN